MRPMLELYTYYSMNKQYVKENEKRAYMSSVSNIAICLLLFPVRVETAS